MNRIVVCKGCHETFNYEYKRGGPRRYCPKCKSWKKNSNAYEEQMFYGVTLPARWGLTRCGSGNIIRRHLGRSIILYNDLGFFGVTIHPRGRGTPEFISSEILFSPENISMGTSWAEGKNDKFGQLYFAH